MLINGRIINLNPQSQTLVVKQLEVAQKARRYILRRLAAGDSEMEIFNHIQKFFIPDKTLCYLIFYQAMQLLDPSSKKLIWYSQYLQKQNVQDDPSFIKIEKDFYSRFSINNYKLRAYSSKYKVSSTKVSRLYYNPKEKKFRLDLRISLKGLELYWLENLEVTFPEKIKAYLQKYLIPRYNPKTKKMGILPYQLEVMWYNGNVSVVINVKKFKTSIKKTQASSSTHIKDNLKIISRIAAATIACQLITSTFASAQEGYKVERGDTLYGIARKTCGHQKFWKEIFDLNKNTLKSPNDLKIGQELKLPTCPGVPADENRYTVKQGENLYRIAQRELGDGSRWQEIYALNKDIIKSPNTLYPGAYIRLPEKTQLSKTKPAKQPIKVRPVVVKKPVTKPTTKPTVKPSIVPPVIKTPVMPVATPTPIPSPSTLVIKPIIQPTSEPSVVAPTPSPIETPVKTAVIKPIEPVLPPSYKGLRIFSNSLSLYYQPHQYSEDLISKEVSSEGLITTTFGGKLALRPFEPVNVEAEYNYGNYALERPTTSESATRVKQSINATLSYVQPIITDRLELKAGLKGSYTSYVTNSTEVLPEEKRETDYLDFNHQRLGIGIEAEFGTRPVMDFPWTLNAVLGYQPMINVMQDQDTGLPTQLWGWNFGIKNRLNIGGIFAEAEYYYQSNQSDSYQEGLQGLKAGVGYGF